MKDVKNYAIRMHMDATLNREWKEMDLNHCPTDCRLKKMNPHPGPPLFVCRASKAQNCLILIHRHDLIYHAPTSMLKSTNTWEAPNVQKT